MVFTQLSKLPSCSSLRKQSNCDWIGCQLVEFDHGVLLLGVVVIGEVQSVLQLLFKCPIDTDLRTKLVSSLRTGSALTKQGA